MNENRFTMERIPAAPKNSRQLIEMLEEMEEVFMIHRSAIREVRTKLEILSDEFQAKRKRNPIEYIKSRVKSAESIAEKLEKGGHELSIFSARKHLDDIAGIRVVCSFVEDIYTIADILMKQDDVGVLEVVDYIKHPKESGYRSLHLVLEIPVFFALHTEKVKVEVQIRTIAMDFWASLEHQLHYKTNNNAPQEIVMDLRDCADVIAITDQRMEEIHKTLEDLS